MWSVNTPTRCYKLYPVPPKELPPPPPPPLPLLAGGVFFACGVDFDADFLGLLGFDCAGDPADTLGEAPPDLGATWADASGLGVVGAETVVGVIAPALVLGLGGADDLSLGLGGTAELGFGLEGADFFEFGSGGTETFRFGLEGTDGLGFVL